MLLAACFIILIIDFIILTILIIFIILITMNTFITYLVGVFLWVSVLRAEKKQSQGKYEFAKRRNPLNVWGASSMQFCAFEPWLANNIARPSLLFWKVWFWKIRLGKIQFWKIRLPDPASYPSSLLFIIIVIRVTPTYSLTSSSLAHLRYLLKMQVSEKEPKWETQLSHCCIKPS